MATTLEDADLDLFEDERFHRKEWAVERLAWSLAALTLVVAAAGLLGDGPLSDARAAGAGVAVEYERAGRRERAMDLAISLAAAPDHFVIDLTGAYFQRAAIEHISPRPVNEEAIAGGARYHFAAAPGAPVRIELRMRPEGAGQRAGEVRVDGQTLAVSMFVYP